jgi:hypothetical protein
VSGDRSPEFVRPVRTRPIDHGRSFRLPGRPCCKRVEV